MIVAFKKISTIYIINIYIYNKIYKIYKNIYKIYKILNYLI